MPEANTLRYKGIEVPRPRGRTAEAARAQLEEALLGRLLELNEIDVPQEKVENEVNGMVAELYQQLRYDSLTNGTPHFFMRDEVEAQMDSIREKARRQIKTDTLLKQIIAAENLTVTKEELYAEAEAMAQRQQIPLERIIDFFGEELSPLKGDLLIRKTLDLICDSAVIQ